MIAAIASGKGGTGKTTVSASLASVWTEALGRRILAVDLDVEEPNLHLFLHPVIARTQAAELEVPVINEEQCNRCGDCRTLCQFGAVTILGERPMIWRSHWKRSTSRGLNLLFSRSLYFQWAATPSSASRCISSVRI